MKWVRLLQLSQTLGVNDIITAFSKHKPAYAFLLPPAELSVLRQPPETLSSLCLCLSYPNNSAALCQGRPLSLKAFITSHSQAKTTVC